MEGEAMEKRRVGASTLPQPSLSQPSASPLREGPGMISGGFREGFGKG